MEPGDDREDPINISSDEEIWIDDSSDEEFIDVEGEPFEEIEEEDWSDDEVADWLNFAAVARNHPQRTHRPSGQYRKKPGG